METPRDPGHLQRPGGEDLGAEPGIERGPQSPGPGPQAPGPGPQAPVPGPQAPASGPQASAPEFPQAPPAGPGYGGPEPPGGWQQPLPHAGPIPTSQLAGWWPRLGAYLIDGLIVGIPAAIILAGLIGLGAAVGDSTGGVVAVLVTALFAVLAVTVVALAYAPLLMRRPGERNGQTWGKQAMNIRAVRTNGLPFDFGTAALREIVLKQLAVGVASSFFFGIPALLNFLWPLWDDDNRAGHDFVAQTRVVRA